MAKDDLYSGRDEQHDDHGIFKIFQNSFQIGVASFPFNSLYPTDSNLFVASDVESPRSELCTSCNTSSALCL